MVRSSAPHDSQLLLTFLELAQVAPLQLPAVQFPASLAALLGYPIPIQTDEQLVSLSTNLDVAA